jgi:hypothetical protein
MVISEYLEARQALGNTQVADHVAQLIASHNDPIQSLLARYVNDWAIVSINHLIDMTCMG